MITGVYTTLPYPGVYILGYTPPYHTLPGTPLQPAHSLPDAAAVPPMQETRANPCSFITNSYRRGSYRHTDVRHTDVRHRSEGFKPVSKGVSGLF